MILIVGKNEMLANALAAKFRDMHFDGEVQVRNNTRLLDFLASHHEEVEMLFFVDKRHHPGSDGAARVEHLQQLWSAAAKLSLPLFLLFFKYRSDCAVDPPLENFIVWTGKQFRKPPLFYHFLTGELYGEGDRDSRVDDLCRQIARTGVAEIVRTVVDGERVECQRDYLYVKDLLRVLYWFAVHRPENGVYELGSGFSRSDSAVAGALFRTLKISPQIRYVDNPDLANSLDFNMMTMDLAHLRRVGYKKPFYPVESGVKSYIHQAVRVGDEF